MNLIPQQSRRDQHLNRESSGRPARRHRRGPVRSALHRRAGLAAGAAILTLGFGLVAPTAAAAQANAPALGISGLNCIRYIDGEFHCLASWVGGLAPFTVEWKAAPAQTIPFEVDQAARTSMANGICSRKGLTVMFTVTDAANQKALASDIACPSG